MFSSAPALPDLTRIPESLWAQVLGSLPEGQRLDAALCQGLDGDQLMRASALAESLPPAPSDHARAALRADPAVPAVPSAGPKHRRSRQVNVRISAADYEMLEVAGGLVGMKPAGLARALIVSGARRMTFELNRQIAAGPDPAA